jgi:hypothetical protein
VQCAANGGVAGRRTEPKTVVIICAVPRGAVGRTVFSVSRAVLQLKVKMRTISILIYLPAIYKGPFC